MKNVHCGDKYMVLFKVKTKGIIDWGRNASIYFTFKAVKKYQPPL